MTALTVEAHDLHARDAFKQGDWTLHVLRVDMDPEAPGASVAVAVLEFGFLLHYAATRLLMVDRPDGA